MIEIMKANEFEQVFSIMENSFPIDEYRTFEEQKALLCNPKYMIYVLPDAGRIKAFLALWRFKEFVFIEHFAVNSRFRNQGLGSLMLRELFDLFPCRICLEAEPPENDLATRRIDFYKRNGFFLNQLPYIQPSISKGRNPLPLLIMTTKGPVAKKEFYEIKSLLYKEVYHVSEQELLPPVKRDNSG